MLKVRLVSIIISASFLTGFLINPVFADSKTLNPCPNYEKFFGENAKFLCHPSNNMSLSLELNTLELKVQYNLDF